MSKLLRGPVGVRNKADAKTLPLHFQILLKHVRVGAAEIELGAKLGNSQVVQSVAIESKQLERKERIYVGDPDFGRSTLLLGLIAGARFRANAMLSDMFCNIRMRDR
nr:MULTISPECIES: hypothetical protein [unclassified Bradyrhizobium]